MRRPIIGLVLVVVLAVELTAGFGWFFHAETAWDDWRHRFAGVRHWPQHVALVVIDDASLNQYKDDPLAFWTPQIAEATQRLREIGASIVGIDFLFSVSPEAWLSRLLPANSKIARSYDAPLRTQINSGQVVLVASQLPDAQTGYDQLLLPDRSFLMAVPDFDFASHIGLANLMADADGVVRHFSIAPKLNLPAAMERTMLPRFGFAPLLAAHVAVAEREHASWDIAGLRRETAAAQAIVYSGPPGTVPRITLSRLLAKSASSDPVLQDLRGKVVILGGEFLSMGDTHLTPYGTGWFSGEGSIMTGAEVQANIVETLLAGLDYRPVPVPGHVALVLLFAIAGASLWHLRGVWRSVGLLLALGLAAMASFSAFMVFVQLDATPLVAALLLAFSGQILLARSPARRHEASLRTLLGNHVGADAIAWLSASRQPLPTRWESYPAAVMALVLPPQVVDADPTAFTRLLDELKSRLWQRGAATSAGEGQMLMAYFGWPRPGVNPCREALAAVQELLTMPSLSVTENIGIGVHVGETVFQVAHGSIIAHGESVAAAVGLAHQALQTGQRALASLKVLQTAAPESAEVIATTVWNSGEHQVTAATVAEGT
jgi:adenylate cyclase